MKKLAFMLVAAVATTSLNAASVYWKATNVYAGNETDKISGIAYFLTTDMLSYNDAKALAGKGADAITAALGSAYSYSGSQGTFSVVEPGVANATLGLADGKDYSAYLMIFNTDTITDSSKFYLTQTKNLTTLMGADDAVNVGFNSQSTNSKVADNWASATSDPEPPIDSPEPTSGLLMLIGAAGLALRRKRA